MRNRDDFDKKFNKAFNISLFGIFVSLLISLGSFVGIGYVIYLLLQHFGIL